MKTRFGIGLGILVAGLTAGICFFGVACGGDDDDDTTGTGTGTGSGSGSGTGTGTGTGVNCTQVCSDVYTCGKSGTPQLCPGFIDQCISEAAWTNGGPDRRCSCRPSQPQRLFRHGYRAQGRRCGLPSCLRRHRVWHGRRWWGWRHSVASQFASLATDIRIVRGRHVRLRSYVFLCLDFVEHRVTQRC